MPHMPENAREEIRETFLWPGGLWPFVWGQSPESLKASSEVFAFSARSRSPEPRDVQQGSTAATASTRSLFLRAAVLQKSPFNVPGPAYHSLHVGFHTRPRRRRPRPMTPTPTRTTTTRTTRTTTTPVAAAAAAMATATATTTTPVTATAATKPASVTPGPSAATTTAATTTTTPTATATAAAPATTRTTTPKPRRRRVRRLLLLLLQLLLLLLLLRRRRLITTTTTTTTTTATEPGNGRTTHDGAVHPCTATATGQLAHVMQTHTNIRDCIS